MAHRPQQRQRRGPPQMQAQAILMQPPATLRPPGSKGVSSGNLDSTAIGDYRDKQQVYYIDRGYDPQGNHTGYRKIIIEDFSESGYKVRVAQLDGSEDTRLSIPKGLFCKSCGAVF